jgi:hypothetical protein
MLNFQTLSSKGNPLLNYKYKLFARSEFARDADHQISKCISSNKGCKAEVNYCIDVAVAEVGDKGLGPGIYDVNESPHDDEYCYTSKTDIVNT